MKAKIYNQISIFSFDKPQDSTGFLLWQVTSLWQRSLNKILRKHNLTHAQFVVLASSFWLGLNSSHVTQIQVANHSKIDKMLASNLLRSLESKKLLNRYESKTDTRANIIVLTPDGKKLLTSTVKEVEGFDRHFFGKLGSNVKNFNLQLLKLTDMK
jgi:MarR family transcriptional regulator, organic hydroperoxide resistance regulator